MIYHETEHGILYHGDWVYNKGIYGKLIDIDTQMNMGSIETADAVYADRDMDSMEKIDPSEVKVKVTLEGTVRKSQLNGCFVLDTPMPGNDVHTIRLVELDPNTAELVKALLKAQEEQ